MGNSRWLNDHAQNVHSQGGEDGVLAAALERLPERDRWCVEFGAWDGRHLSNTFNLIDGDGYHGVLIEGSEERFDDLVAGIGAREEVHPIHALVGWEGPARLDALLAGTPIPKDFDLLSIDIDGNDFHVWKGLRDFRPKMVIIEFNPTIPDTVDFVQPADPEVQQGCSARALVRLGHEKGYELVACTDWNAVFVDKKFFPLYEIEDNSLETLWTFHDQITWIFSGFDGTVHLTGYRELPWHQIPMTERQAQQLPKILRQYPGNFAGLHRKILYRVFKQARRLRARRR